jgi:uncharacterized protein YndB with AHSA1/START domain
MAAMWPEPAPPPIVRAVHVRVPPERAFVLFTDGIGAWWPLHTHSVSEDAAAHLAFAGGLLLETDPSGQRHAWGEVLAWEPPHRVRFSWRPAPGPAVTAPATVVEVRFTADEDGTRVVLTHSGWEVFDDAAERARGYAAPGGWSAVLTRFAEAATQPA